MFFLFRMLGLIRGLCTTLEVKLPYLEIMSSYAQKGLVLDFDRKVGEREGGREGGREGRREGGKEGGRKGGK
jgi:hypothetical protein